MKSGKCPKCGSEAVFSGDDLFPKSGPFGINAIPVSLASLAALDNYVCIDCGYLERYVADPEKCKEIGKKWRAVNTSKE